MHTIAKRSKAQKQLDHISQTEPTLGTVLNAIRQSEEATLERFSKELGISKQYLCDLAKERQFASPKSAVAYAKALGYAEHCVYKTS